MNEKLIFCHETHKLFQVKDVHFTVKTVLTSGCCAPWGQHVCQWMFLPGAVEPAARRALGLLRQEVPQTAFGSTERRTASLPGTWPATSTMAAAIPTAM